MYFGCPKKVFRQCKQVIVQKGLNIVQELNVMDIMPFSALILQLISEVIIMLVTGAIISGLEIKKRLGRLILVG